MTGWRLRVALGAGLAVALASAACDAPTAEPPDPPGPGPGVVEGVDLDALFEAPSPVEQQQVARDVASRPPSVAAVVPVQTIELANRESIHVAAGLDANGDTAFVGAIRQPPRLPGDQRARPLLLVLSYGPDVELETALGVPPLRADLQDEFVTVVAGYRGQRLRVGGRTYASGRAAEPYDTDASDAAALVAYARARAGEDRADPDRLVVVGWGRGGTVALLASARGLRSQLVVTLGAPTDFFLPSVRADARRFLLRQPLSRLPEVEPVLLESVGALRDGLRSPAEARRELLARSPAYAGALATYVVAVHGEVDVRVPVEHGRRLAGAGSIEDVYLEIDGADAAGVLQSNEVISTVSNLVCQRVLPAEPDCDA